MSGSTTQGLCTNDVQRRSSMPDSRLTSCYRSSNKRCALSRKQKRSVRRETTTLSSAGIGACACSKIQPTFGIYGKQNALRSTTRTHRRHSQLRSHSPVCRLESKHPRRHRGQLFFTEAIADMALGQDINGVSRVVFNFLSQLIDDNA